jgi:hypothetical protein
MNSTPTSNQEAAFNPIMKWVIVIWFGLGLVLLLASFQISFALERTVAILVGLASISVSVLVVSNKRFLEALKRSEPSAIRRAALLLSTPLFFAVVSWANLYTFFFSVHSMMGEREGITLVVSSKSEATPHRQQWTTCKQYVRFREFAGYPGGKWCVSRDVFDRIEFGNQLSALALRSQVGFSIEHVRFDVQRGLQHAE